MANISSDINASQQDTIAIPQEPATKIALI
jgi:hypothetical protein